MHVWITKYALTKGVVEAEATGPDEYGDICLIGEQYRYAPHVRKGDWHASKVDADADVLRRIDAKLKSIEKQVKKLHALRKQFGG